jgi:hypothetical protein
MITPDMIRAQLLDFSTEVGSPAMEHFISLCRQADEDNSVGKLAFILSATGGHESLEKYVLGYMYAGYRLAQAEMEIERMERSVS